MEIRHRTISDLRLNAYGKSKSDMIAEMQENCEVYNELVAPVTYNENDFIFEWESSEVITICKKNLQKVIGEHQKQQILELQFQKHGELIVKR